MLSVLTRSYNQAFISTFQFLLYKHVREYYANAVIELGENFSLYAESESFYEADLSQCAMSSLPCSKK